MPHKDCSHCQQTKSPNHKPIPYTVSRRHIPCIRLETTGIWLNDAVNAAAMIVHIIYWHIDVYTSIIDATLDEFHVYIIYTRININIILMNVFDVTLVHLFDQQTHQKKQI